MSKVVVPSASRLQAVCLGETMAQLTSTDSRPLDIAENFSIRAAGAESNVAHGLAQLGSRASWISRLGDDALGHRILSEVVQSGVDVSKVRFEATARTGFFVKDPKPTGSTIIYYREFSAASMIGAEDMDIALARDPEVIHLTGITPALSASCREATEYGLSAAFSRGIRTSFDVNYRAHLWGSPELAREVLTPLVNAADIVFVGLDEAKSLWGTASPAEVRRILPEPDVIIVKDGGREAIAFGRETTVSVPALSVEVIEPVGAGDAFAAGWLHGMLQGFSDEARLRLGHLMAAAALRSPTDHFPITVDPEHLVRMVMSNPWGRVRLPMNGVS